jgi:hypothetical protein
VILLLASLSGRETQLFSSASQRIVSRVLQLLLVGWVVGISLLAMFLTATIPTLLLLLGRAQSMSLPSLPSARGSHSTTTSDFYVGGFLAGGNQDAYLVFPEDYEEANFSSFPLVAFAHGCCKNSVNQSASDYNSIFVHLASHGMVVASFNTCLDTCNMITFSGDQLHLISALHNNPSLHPVIEKIDFTRVGLFGHSMGGGSTVFSAANSTIANVTVKVAVAIDPAPSIAAGKIEVPTFFWMWTERHHCSMFFC